MEYIIITGMSGAGKTAALKVMEDIGYYCVDNLPVFLIDKFIEMGDSEDTRCNKVALGIDSRSGRDLQKLEDLLKELKKHRNTSIRILFLDASDTALVKRYKETRRFHPLAKNGRIEDGIRKEREMMRFLREDADWIIDTSNLLTKDLRQALEDLFLRLSEYRNLFVTVMSFGFKYGLPADSDLVFDVRFLPNPYYEAALKEKTGNDKEVRDFVMQGTQADTFLNLLKQMVDYLLPNYVAEGKNRLVISIGCTGGRHRSVTIANALYDYLEQKRSLGINLIHRDL